LNAAPPPATLVGHRQFVMRGARPDVVRRKRPRPFLAGATQIIGSFGIERLGFG